METLDLVNEEYGIQRYVRTLYHDVGGELVNPRVIQRGYNILEVGISITQEELDFESMNVHLTTLNI